MRTVISAVAAALLGGPLCAATFTFTDELDGSTTFTPFETPETIAEFFNLTGDNPTPPFSLSPDTMHVFLHRDTNTGVLGFGVIVDDPALDGGGRLKFSLKDNFDGAVPQVADNSNDVFGWDDDGDVDGLYRFKWTPASSDGLAFDMIPGDDWEMRLQFRRIRGLSSFALYSGDWSSPTIYEFGTSGLEYLDRIIITSTPDPAAGLATLPTSAPTHAPVPASLPLILFGLGALGAARRFRRKA